MKLKEKMRNPKIVLTAVLTAVLLVPVLGEC